MSLLIGRSSEHFEKTFAKHISKQLPFALCTIPETKIVNIPQIFCISKQLKVDNNTRVLRVKSIYLPHNFTLILLNLMHHIANYALFDSVNSLACALTLYRAYIYAFPPRILDARCSILPCKAVYGPIDRP